MPRPLSSRLKSIQSLPLSALVFCAFAGLLVILLGDPQVAPFPGYQPVHWRRSWHILYVQPWAKLWSDRLFLFSAVCLMVALLFIPFIRFIERRERR